MIAYFQSSELFQQEKKYHSLMSEVCMFQVLVPQKVFSGMGHSIKQILLYFLHIPQKVLIWRKKVLTTILGIFLVLHIELFWGLFWSIFWLHILTWCVFLGLMGCMFCTDISPFIQGLGIFPFVVECNQFIFFPPLVLGQKLHALVISLLRNRVFYMDV